MLAISSLEHKTFVHMEIFWIRPDILGGENLRERSNFVLKIEFFIFS